MPEEEYYCYENLDKFVDVLKGLQEKDMDVLIPVTGFKGVGKSTFALQLTRRYLQKYWNWQPEGVTFDTWFKRHLRDFIAYDNFDVMNKIEKAADSQPLVCDEAVRFAMSEDWMKAESKELKKMFAQIRTKHLIIIFAIPEFWWIDRKYREDMTLFWAHIIQRGFAVVFTPDMKIGVKDKWHRDIFMKVNRPVNIFTPADAVLSYYRKHPCYWDEIKFPPLPQDIYAKYLTMRNEHVIQPNLRVVPNWALDLVLYKIYRKKWQYDGERITYEKLIELFRDPITGKLPFPSLEAGKRFVERRIAEVEELVKQRQSNR